MVSWTGNSREAIADIARRHGFSEAAGAAMAEAIAYSGGAMAQFHHPELGGMGQWSRGGMLMIGDMFNDSLKGRVRALADELSGALHQGALTFDRATATGALGHWWPEALGTPSSTGAQNGRRYAVFPDKRRLAIETNDGVRLYDTGEHRIGGASQRQGAATTLSFGSDRGTVGLGDFSEVASEAATAPRPIEPNAAETSAPEKSAPVPSAAPIVGLRTQTQPPPSAVAERRHPTEAETPRSSTMRAAAPGDPIVLLQRLAELKSAGILSDEEFAAKKAELLARI